MKPSRVSYADSEIASGLAPFLSSLELRESSDFLARFGLDHTSADSPGSKLFAAGDRYFVVVGRALGLVALTPVYSMDKPYRLPITRKTGHPGWIDHSTYFDPRQVWLASADAIVRAANLAGDLSPSSHRNRVSPDGILDIRSAIRGAFTPPQDRYDVA